MEERDTGRGGSEKLSHQSRLTDASSTMNPCLVLFTFRALLLSYSSPLNSRVRRKGVTEHLPLNSLLKLQHHTILGWPRYEIVRINAGQANTCRLCSLRPFAIFPHANKHLLRRACLGAKYLKPVDCPFPVHSRSSVDQIDDSISKTTGQFPPKLHHLEFPHRSFVFNPSQQHRQSVGSYVHHRCRSRPITRLQAAAGSPRTLKCQPLTQPFSLINRLLIPINEVQTRHPQNDN